MKRTKEEEIKNKVAARFFLKFDCNDIIGNIDFAVKLKRPANAINFADEYLLWAEAKRDKDETCNMLTQLVLTIGKARTFDEINPPAFLGCYDSEKIAFIPYSEIQDIFYQNDFNWKVAPSDKNTNEFNQIYKKVKNIIENDIPFATYLFHFERDEKDLKKFIHDNFIVGKSNTTKLKIDKNNFINIYRKWADTVKSTIAVNWDLAKKSGIIDGDFYLADLISENNKSLKDKLFVLLKSDVYEIDRHINEAGIFTSSKVEFSDNQLAHTQFWAKYDRPPLEDYWDYIVNRRDLLVPQDIREEKGSFFTPPEWVAKSQEYLAEVLGEDWQDEYYIWDCCAGSGNLLAGLVNKDRIFASTLDKQDVDVMLDRIKNGANLWKEHIFKFDFLNDDFKPISKDGKLPDKLYEIISDEKKRKKLVIYINPPYAEATSSATMYGKKKNKSGVAVKHKTRDRFQKIIGKATNELFAQFLARIYADINGCMIGEFSTLKAISGTSFVQFRNFFTANLEKAFIVPANTFDNVKGQFPIGFKIWNTAKKIRLSDVIVDVFDKNNQSIGQKSFYSFEKSKYINDWINQYKDNTNTAFGILNTRGNDFQNQNYITIEHNEVEIIAHSIKFNITVENLIYCTIYFAVRKVIPASWINDRDQFLFPNNGWETDMEFQNDCLAFALFNNNIQSKYGKNHWIPFSEKELGIDTPFASHFMHDFMNGKLAQNGYSNLFEQTETKYCIKRSFSIEAKNVFKAGKAIWEHYHSQDKKKFDYKFGRQKYNVNASYYDIRAYFKGFELNKAGKEQMNKKSTNTTFNNLETNLSQSLAILAKKIEPKLFLYGFLKKH